MEEKYNPKKRNFSFSITQPAGKNPVKRIPKNFTPPSIHRNSNDKFANNHYKSLPKRLDSPHKFFKVESDDFYSKQTRYTQNRPSASSHHFHHPWEAGNEFISPHRYNTKSQDHKGDEEDYDSEEIFHLSIDYPPIGSSIKFIDFNLERYNTETLKFKKLSKSEYDVIFLVKGRISLTSHISMKDGKIHLVLRNGSTESFKSPEDFISRYINKVIANCEKIFDRRNFGVKADNNFRTMDFSFNHIKHTTFEVTYSPLRTRFFLKEFVKSSHHGFKFRNRLFLSLEEVIESLKEDTELMDRSQKEEICWMYFVFHGCSNARCEKAHRFNKWNLPKVFENRRISEKEFNERILKDPKFINRNFCHYSLVEPCQKGDSCTFSHSLRWDMLSEKDTGEVKLFIQSKKIMKEQRRINPQN